MNILNKKKGKNARKKEKENLNNPVINNKITAYDITATAHDLRVLSVLYTFLQERNLRHCWALTQHHKPNSLSPSFSSSIESAETSYTLSPCLTPETPWRPALRLARMEERDRRVWRWALGVFGPFAPFHTRASILITFQQQQSKCGECVWMNHKLHRDFYTPAWAPSTRGAQFITSTHTWSHETLKATWVTTLDHHEASHINNTSRAWAQTLQRTTPKMEHQHQRKSLALE